MKLVRGVSKRVSVKISMNALRVIVKMKNNATTHVAVTDVIVDYRTLAETVKSKLPMSH